MRHLTVLFAVLLASTAHADNIRILQSVGEGAKGAAEARVARDAITADGARNLIPVLKGFKGSSPLAKNWLRSAFEAIADAEIKAGGALPKQELINFVKATSESPVARRLAYEWLLKRSPELEARLIPEMLLDPSPEFRRDAVTNLVKQAEAADGDTALTAYKQAMKGAVHEDQVKSISKALREAGVEVNIQQHFGFLTSWKIIGPFNNKDKVGYAIAYPPESSIDLSAEYDGQLGKVKWHPISSEDDYGIVDIAKDVENYKGSLMYVTTTYNSTKDQRVELRLGTPNAWKLWVNDELVFEREEYHRSTRMDQFRIPVSLSSGPNTVMLKVCQNEQTDSWAQKYQFQIRVCDNTGSAVLPTAKTAVRSDVKEAK